jgi:protein transport protein SEC24
MAEQKKKRAYAAQAYDFGANSVGSAPPPPPFSPGMGAPMQQQGIPQQGFPPQQGFVSQGAPPQGFPPGIQPQSPIDPLAQGFGQMNLGGQPQQVTPQTQAPGHVNPLLTTDLVTQPFHVLELEVRWVYDCWR